MAGPRGNLASQLHQPLIGRLLDSFEGNDDEEEVPEENSRGKGLLARAACASYAELEELKRQDAERAAERRASS